MPVHIRRIKYEHALSNKNVRFQRKFENHSTEKEDQLQN